MTTNESPYLSVHETNVERASLRQREHRNTKRGGQTTIKTNKIMNAV